MKNRTIKQLLTLFSLVALLVLPYFVFAGSSGPMDNLQDVGEGGGYESADETTLSSMAGEIVNVFLGFLGIIFIILIIYAGFKWMTAGGNEDKIKEARTMITRAIIGLLIVIGSWAIWNFIFSRLL